ncbi:hypothetical protein M1D52_22175 [Olivibacter sp. SA151]|uniref:right-handed parallel beta-helix repeat-containing protein n=1 Tax=Olivibacter jilunii TaxID=985016 RepID=UPI003F143693
MIQGLTDKDTFLPTDTHTKQMVKKIVFLVFILTTFMYVLFLLRKNDGPTPTQNREKKEIANSEDIKKLPVQSPKEEITDRRDLSDTIFVKDFGAKADGKTDDTKAIQAALDKNSKVVVFQKGTYLVSKNSDLAGFPNMDQPCLLIRNKNNYKVIGNDATLVVMQHAQGILELQASENIVVQNLKLRGPGNFPPLDGETGRGEKGIATAGYNTSGFWGYYKNNCHNTSSNQTGGYNKEFPQKSGTKNRSWGKWNNGFIGNVAYGLLIHNGCNNIVIESCEATEFNYVGIGVGHNGDYFPKKLNYPRSRNITFKNCHVYRNYSAGFHSMAVDNFKIVGGQSSGSGHPDASINDQNCDPGYGYTSRGSDTYTVKATIEGVLFSDNKRKGIDAHAGENLSFINNTVKNSPVCGIYAAWTSESQKVIGIRILSNIIDNTGYGPASLGAIYVGADNNSNIDQRTVNSLIKGNIIKNYSCSAIRVRYGNYAQIIGNKIYSAKKGVLPNLSSILVVGKNEKDLAKNIDIIDNSIQESGPLIERGIQLSNVEEGNVTNNTITFDKDINIGVFTKNTNKISIINNNINLKGKGRALAVQGTTNLKQELNKANGTAIKKE